MAKVKNYIGLKYGRLTVIGMIGKKRACLCDCGNISFVQGASLVNGTTKSCGCLQREVAAKVGFRHGQCTRSYISGSYSTWLSMKQRCLNPNHTYYKNYGGRGIGICEEWKNDFRAFLRDMGERPMGMTIDRIDPCGNYCKENCRWADRKTQANNTRKKCTHEK